MTGILLIGFLFYIVNIKESSTSKESVKKEEMKKVEVTGTKQKNPTDKSYRELFKEKKPVQSDAERITREERIKELRKSSNAIIEETNKLIEEKNLRLPKNKPDPEKLEVLRKKIEELKAKRNNEE